MQEINIGVLGAAGVGKTTFVHKALELRSAPLTAAASKKLSLDGRAYVLRLVELQLDELEIDDYEPLQWPSTIDDDMAMPRIDGILTLYDVMDKDSLGQVPAVLSQYTSQSKPTSMAPSSPASLGRRKLILLANRLSAVRCNTKIITTFSPRCVQMRQPSHSPASGSCRRRNKSQVIHRGRDCFTEFASSAGNAAAMFVSDVTGNRIRAIW